MRSSPIQPRPAETPLQLTIPGDWPRPKSISSEMLPEEVAKLLVEHGCKDITAKIDFKHCNHIPFTRGGFGIIHQGVMRNGQLVAIKCIEMFGNWGTWRPHGKHWKHAAHELYAWSKCDHPGVLKALGFALIEGFILLISPWMRNGPLSSYSGRTKPCSRLKFCLEIAHTLEYIHHKGIVHGDLKAENVLVSDTGHTQLVDFGSATLTNYLSLCFTQTSRTHGLSLRFAAPEILDGEPHTIESDVYALGMTILQILTGELPYAGMSDRAVVASVFRQITPARPVFDGVIGCQRANDKLWDLLLRCWDHDPKSRPTAGEVANTLIEIAE